MEMPAGTASRRKAVKRQGVLEGIGKMGELLRGTGDFN